MKKNLFLTIIAFIAFNGILVAQTNPTAQNLPFTMGSISSTTLPAGIAAHRFGTTSGAIPTSRILTSGNADLSAGSGSTGGYSAQTTDGIGLLASGSQSAGAIVIALNTTGKKDIDVAWTCKTILQQASRDHSIGLQYRIGTSGNFTDLGDASHVYTSQGQTAGHSTDYTLRLPAACDNQSVVQLRWLYWESNGTSGSRDRIAVGKVSVTYLTTLPVNFTSFTAKNFGNAVNFTFSTASETNNNYFTIERSADGKNFSPIVTINSYGTTSENQIYSTADYSPFNGTNYYRLKQTDNDGNFTYYPEIRVINILSDKEDNIKVYPNPVVNNIRLQLPEEENTNISLKIISPAGTTVITTQGTLEEIHQYLDRNVYALNNGVYTLQIYGNNDKSYYAKFIKQ